MKLSEVMKVWKILHVKDTGDIGFCDLEKAIDNTIGVENDIAGCAHNATIIKGTITIPEVKDGQ